MKKTRKKTYRFGILAEKVTILFLRLKGYQILHWRYKTHLGEVDIIAKKSRVIVAIEVKARRGQFLIEEILHPKQLERVKRAAEIFYSKNPKFHNHDLRFDFVEVNRFFWPKHHINFF
jgi:putative endonuclease